MSFVFDSQRRFVVYPRKAAEDGSRKLVGNNCLCFRFYQQCCHILFIVNKIRKEISGIFDSLVAFLDIKNSQNIIDKLKFQRILTKDYGKYCFLLTKYYNVSTLYKYVHKASVSYKKLYGKNLIVSYITKMPQKFNLNINCPVHFQKGFRSEVKNYRGTDLLNVAYNFLESIISEILKP